MKHKLLETQNSIKIFCIIMTIVSVCGLPLLLNERLGFVGFSNSLCSVFFVPLIYMLYRKCVEQINQTESDWNTRRMGYSLVCSILLSLALVLGKGLDEAGELPIKQPGAWIGILIYTVVFAFLAYSFLCYLDNTRLTQEPSPITQKEEKNAPVWAIFLFFVLCYGIVLLAVYPGFFNYDAADEYNEVAMRLFNTHHPLTHVVLLGGIICGVHKITGSFNLGIFSYTFLQMLVMSGIFTYLIISMRRWKVSKKARVITMLYLALFPANVMFVLCSAKDTFCAGFLVLSIIELIHLQTIDSENHTIEESNPNSDMPEKCMQPQPEKCMQPQPEKCMQLGSQIPRKQSRMLHNALLVGSLTGAMLFRNNVLYAVLVCVVISILVTIIGKNNKNNRKKYILYAVAGILSIVLSWGINKTLIQVLHADHYENQEMLTVPIQQVARIWKVDATQFSDEELDVLYQIIPQKALQRYTPNLSDPVKYYFDNQAYEQNKAAFWRLWFKGFTRNPIGYVNAWLMTSYGYWYPDTIVNVYEGHNVYSFTYKDSSFFAYETEPPGERSSIIPGLDELYRKMSLEIAQQKIPGLSMFFSMGFLFWVFFLMAMICFYEKKGQVLIPFVPSALVWLTLLLGPTYLPRYVTFMWFSLPIILCVRFFPRK